MKIKVGLFQWSSRAEHRRMLGLMVVALVALVAGISVLVGIVRLPVAVPRATSSDPATLNIAHMGDKQRNRILDEEALLLDPAPLFLPTSHNYTQADLASISHREPEQAFRAFPPSYAYSDDAFTIRYPDPVQIPARPVEALGYGHTQTPYATLGRAEFPLAPLPARQASVEVVHAGTGRVVLELPVPQPETRPADMPDALATGDWSPLEFLAAIDVTGLAAPPTLIKGTGPPAVVQYLSKYLDKNLHIGFRLELAPGLYIVRIGP
ncbi:hypothetical protein M2103_000599 [Ereboglobus sp. PH5-5]|uniref:hypothetical protein n=1 Tax=Ereboglobus sp. PH5-5 TaxID=2940529 RepID=UPI002405E7DB|nr:hypothetical protein [Ereboglobus sp. PH5-5]MDF9832389.1 hypothetical protein [Ereboglobus sp. PH5-5]